MSLLFLPSQRRVLPSLQRLVFLRRNWYLLGANLSTAAGSKASEEFNESPFAICRFDWKDPLQMRHQLTEEEASNHVNTTRERSCDAKGNIKSYSPSLCLLY